MANNGAWSSTPTGSGSVTIPKGYHNGSGKVNTTTVYKNGYNAGYSAGVTAGGMNYKTLYFATPDVWYTDYITSGTYTATKSGVHLFTFAKWTQDASNDFRARALLNGTVISSSSSSRDQSVWCFAYNLSKGQTVTFQLYNTYYPYPCLINGSVSF